MSSGKVTRASWKRYLLVIGLTSLIVYLILRYIVGFSHFFDTLGKMSWGWFGAAIGVLCLNIFLSSLRWGTILRAMGYRVPVHALLEAILATWPIALVTLSRAGDLLRAYVLRDRVPQVENVGSVISEKCIDVQSLCLLAGAGCLLSGLWLPGVLCLLGLLALWIAIWGSGQLIARLFQWGPLQRFAPLVTKLFQSFGSLRRAPRLFLLASFLSLWAWINTVIMITFLLWSVGIHIHWTYVAGLWPLALLAGQLPVTFGGLGTRDVAFLSLLAFAGVARSEALGVATLWYGILVACLPAVLGLPWMFRHFWKVEWPGGKAALVPPHTEPNLETQNPTAP